MWQGVANRKFSQDGEIARWSSTILQGLQKRDGIRENKKEKIEQGVFQSRVGKVHTETTYGRTKIKRIPLGLHA